MARVESKFVSSRSSGNSYVEHIAVQGEKGHVQVYKNKNVLNDKEYLYKHVFILKNVSYIFITKS